MSLEAILESPPIYLSDFIGGSGSIYDGYSTHTDNFTIVKHEYSWCICAIFSEGTTATLIPPKEKIENPANPLVQTRELPLAIGRHVFLAFNSNEFHKSYEITRISW